MKTLKTHQSPLSYTTINKYLKKQLSLAESSTTTSEKVIQEAIAIPSMHVSKAEILLALQAIMTNISQRSVESFVQLTKVVFSDSEIPDQL